MKPFILSLLLGLSSIAFSQEVYTNNWINKNQTYYKFSITKNGVYRLSYQNLKALAVPFLGQNPKNIQLFHNGKEVAILLNGEADGSFDAADYIEFYGEANTGELDSLVYKPNSARPKNDYSLYTDESVYFLTYNATNTGKRIEKIAFKNIATAADKFHLEHQIKNYQDEWSFNNSIGLVPLLQQSYYERGEGWTGKYILKDSLAKISIPLSNYVANEKYPIQLKTLVNGRNYVSHNIDLSVANRKFANLNFFGFDHFDLQTEVKDAELTAQNEIILSAKAAPTDVLELYSFSRYEAIYPQSFSLKTDESKLFYLLQNSNNQSFINISGGNSKYLAYDITEPQNPKQIETQLAGNTLGVYVPNTAQNRKLYVSPTINEITTLSKVDFTNYEGSYNYVIITHKSLENSANTFADYRKSQQGGGYNVLVADIQQLYDQFNYGYRGPMAIKNFLNYELKDGNKDKFLLLVGRGVSFPDVLKTWQDRDLVPTFGYPGSDVLLSAGLGGVNENVSTFKTGRLNVTTNQQVINYLTKVKEQELAAPSLAMKRFLHLSGGESKDEIATLKNDLLFLAPLIADSFLGGNVSAISKQTDNPVENVDISKPVNEGVGMITFLGHASPTVPDLNIGFVSSPTAKIANKKQYPFMFFNGCGVGNVFYRYETLSTDWLLTPDKGSVGILANSFWSYTGVSNKYLEVLYKTMFNDSTMLGKPIGNIIKKTAEKITSQPISTFTEADLHQLVYQGDPAVVFFKIQKPDFQTNNKSIFIQSKSISTTINKSDSLQVGVIITNLGKVQQNQSIGFQLKKTFNGGKTETIIQTLLKTIAYQDTVYLNFKRDTEITKLEVSIDYNQKIDEYDETNNIAELTIDWSKTNNVSTYPASIISDKTNPVLDVLVDDKRLKNGAEVTKIPTITIFVRDENPLSTDTSLVAVYLKKGTGSFEKINAKSLIFNLIDANTLEVIYKPQLTAGKYELLVNAKDANQNAVGNPYRISWVVTEQASPVKVLVAPNPASYYVKFLVNIDNEASDSQLFIYSTSGQLIDTPTFTTAYGENEILWKAPTAGLYTYKMKVGDKVFTGKFYVE